MAADDPTASGATTADIVRDLDEVVANSPDGVAVLREGIYAYANRAWCNLLGFERLEGRAIVDDVHADDRRAVLAWLAERRQVDKPARAIECRFLCRDGRTLIIELTPIPVGSGRALVARDVTARKEQQARLLLADRMMSVGALASGVAHEINNPLSYLMGNLEFLADELEHVSPDVLASRLSDLRDAVAEAREGAERVRKIVRTLQSFARKDWTAKTELSVVDVLEGAINMAWVQIRQRARLVRDFHDVPPTYANEARLGQVFLNLLLNAAEALPEGEADAHTIRVSCVADEDKIIVTIEDSGPGIPAEILDRLFDPFFTTKPVGMGTGLGLSISHSIITDIRGTIAVESKVGEGTTVEVTLPAARRTRSSLSQRPISAVGARGIRDILIVDDEVLVLSALRRALRDHAVTVASGGREAIALFEAGRNFAIVFCDLQMRELGGARVYGWVKEHRPELAERIVFMTGGAVSAEAEAFLASVENRRIAKPFDVAEVRALVRAAIDLNRAEPREPQ